MQVKNVLVAALMGIAAVEGSAIPGSSPYAKTLARRQFRGGFGGGGFGGGNNNNNDNNNNDDQNNGDQNNGDQNNGDQNNDGNNDNNNNDGGNGGNGNLALDPALVQEGSQQPGNPQDGAVESDTDDANFINFCQGEDLTNGEQKTGGSCNGIPMGRIPAQNRMVSSILRFPQHNDNLEEGQDFDIEVQVANFNPGAFTDAQSTYYSAPQNLGNDGSIIGHTHVTVQDMAGNFNPEQPLDATQFAFFKGINDAGNGNGLLSATVEGGLPAGTYRVCTMFAASNHQPVLMPVAQRGAQDDCNKFTVGGNNNNGGDNNDGNNGDNNGGDNNGGDNNNGDNNNNGGGGFGGGFGGNDNNDESDDNAQDGGDQGNNNDGNNGNDGQNNDNAQDGGDQGNNNDGNDGNDGQNDNNNGGGGGGAGGASAGNALGGIAAPEITDSGNGDRPFEVNGNTFTDQATAAQRACDIQNNACSDASNGGGADFTLQDCNAQVAACVAELS